MKGNMPTSGLIKVIFQLLIAVGIGLITLFIGLISDSLVFQKFVIALIPVALVFKLFFSCVVLTVEDRRNLFRPITAFIFSCGLYHGIGVMICSFGSYDQISSIRIYQDFDNLALIWILILNQLSIFIVLGSYLLLSIFFGPPTDFPNQPVEPKLELFPFLIILGLWGLAVKFLIMLPWDLKIVDQAPAGLIVGTHSLSYGTLFYLWYRAGRVNKITIFILILTGLDVLYGLIALQKMPVLLPIITSFLGYLAATPIRVRNCILVGLAGLVMLSVLQPVNTFLRYRRQTSGPITMSETINLFSLVTDRDFIDEFVDLRKTGAHKDSAWTRLSYVDVQAFVMARREAGQNGDTYRYFRHLFIPRWFWKDKPIVNPGLDFNKEWFGLDNSAIGLTLFGEAFFNLGWIGIVMMGVILAVILRLFEAPMQWVLARGKFEQSMLLFLGIFLGLRVDEWGVMLISTAISGGVFSVVIAAAWRLWSGRFSPIKATNG